tara:strand:+ start:298 stop:477 length:180 start_codon:yes stop_codon:yes gene_type:complete
MSEMSRIPESLHEVGLEDGDAEGVAGERDPLRSVDNVRISKLKIVVNGETIYDHGSEEE